MPGLVVYKGIDVDGRSITVLSGEAMIDDVAKQASDHTGVPLGAPRFGSVLTRVAEIDMTPVIRRVSPEDVVFMSEPAPPEPEPAPAPIAKRVQLQNAAMLGPLCNSLKMKVDEMGLATGIVMEPNDGDDGYKAKPDTQNQVTSGEDIERAMIYWACNGGSVDLMHSFEAIMDERVDVVESWVARSEFDLGGYTVKVGTWLMTTKWMVTGKYWADIKAGTFNAYSIGGLGQTLPLDGGGAE